MKAEARPLIRIKSQQTDIVQHCCLMDDYHHPSLAKLDPFGQSFDNTCHMGIKSRKWRKLAERERWP